jgi:hypothetical protein
MSKYLRNRFAHRTADQFITHHTVIFSTDVENPDLGRHGKASFWIKKGTDLAGPPVADTVFLRRHINRDDEGLEDPSLLRFQMPGRAEDDLSARARSDGRFSTAGPSRWSGSMLQFAIGASLPFPEHWVGLSEILDMREASSDPDKTFMGADDAERKARTAYIRRYYGLDS